MYLHIQYIMYINICTSQMLNIWAICPIKPGCSWNRFAPRWITPLNCFNAGYRNEYRLLTRVILFQTALKVLKCPANTWSPASDSRMKCMPVLSTFPHCSYLPGRRLFWDLPLSGDDFSRAHGRTSKLRLCGGQGTTKSWEALLTHKKGPTKGVFFRF